MPLGYDPQIGARFFGIGNEVMGLLLSIAIISTTLLVDRVRDYGGTQKVYKFLSALLYLIIIFIFILTYPELGAKAGGTITVVASFAVVTFMIFRIRIGQSR